MKYSPSKVAQIVTAGDFMLSIPLILAMHLNIFDDVDKTNEFALTFDPVWNFIHSPTARLMDRILFYGEWNMHDPIPLWFSLAHYGASFLQTFVIAFALFRAFDAYRKFAGKPR